MKYPIEAWEEAANFDDAASVDEMLRDVEPGDLDGDGETTPLHAMAAAGYYLAVVRLVDAGANVSAEDSEGRTPMDVAMENDQQEVVDFLIGVSPPVELAAEMTDMGFEEESDSYLVEMKLSRPSTEMYSKAVGSASAPLCESRMSSDGGQVFELRVLGARSFKEAVDVLADEYGFEYDEEEPEQFDDDSVSCVRCGMRISDADFDDNGGLCGFCAHGDFGPAEEPLDECTCSACGDPVETREYGTYGGMHESCAVKMARR